MKHAIICCLALTGVLAVAGCRSYCKEKQYGWCDPGADIPAGAIPQPAGTHSSQWFATQAALADRDDFVVYQYEWQADHAQLGPFGKRHVSTLADRLISEPAQITIEPSDDEALDTARLEVLVILLAERGVAGADQRVVVAHPSAEGLHGREAPQISNAYFTGGGRGQGSSSGSNQNSFGGGNGGGFGGGGAGLGF